jgi:hypothetical protein
MNKSTPKTLTLPTNNSLTIVIKVTNLKHLHTILSNFPICLFSFSKVNKRYYGLLYALRDGNYYTFNLSHKVTQKVLAIGAAWPTTYKYIVPDTIKSLIDIEKK